MSQTLLEATPGGKREKIMRAFLTRLVVAAVLAAGSLAGVAKAQALYGSIVGNVTDPQGGVLHGVSVTITNTGTGLRLETTTDDTGSYIFRNLLPGTYDMTLSFRGFKETRQSGIVVTAGNPKRIDAALQIGGAQESVTVSAEAATLHTEKSDLTTEINSVQVTSLPLNQYRNYQTLLNLVPGATPVQFQNAEIDTPGRSMRTWVNGTQPNSNTTRVDGAVSVNVWLPHHAGYIQPAETIETVNISTNNFDADIGMAGGAAQTVVTKSGTNEFHGSAFEFMNFDELNANSFANNANSFAKSPLSHHIYGGTIGGPIKKDKLFFFGSYEKLRDRRGSVANYVVPTDKMWNGDFTEVAALFPEFNPTTGALNNNRFLLFDPATGDIDPATGVRVGTNRERFDTFKIPAVQISDIAKRVRERYPKVNSTIDLNRNGLLDDYSQERVVKVDRANYDSKINWQRSTNHTIWGKFSMLRADVVDNFILGFDEGANGDTKVYQIGVGHTWTLSPSLLLDGNFGIYRMDQIVTGPDFGTNYGLDLGIKGVNDPNDIRASGLPTFENGYTIGSTPNWMPLDRKERNYSFSSALTKIFPKHELRVGVDIVKLELNHLQAEFGTYGLKGGFAYSGNATGLLRTQAQIDAKVPQYTARAWNQFAAFLLDRPTSFAKDTQAEPMTGREWQTGFYVRDRWKVTTKLTLNLGLRMEYFPFMSRANGVGVEVLDYDTYNVMLGGRGNVPKDVGLDIQTWFAEPRVGVAYRIGDNGVIRVGYGQTVNPLPWSRPLRGSFPYDVNFNDASNGYVPITNLQNRGIPTVVIPDLNSGVVKLPSGVFMRSLNTGFEAFPGAGTGLDRATIKQYNVAYEHKLPFELITEVAYVGTRTDGGYADLNINYGEPGDAAGVNTRRRFNSVAGTTAINDWAARTRARYNSLQVALNRPFRNGLMLKGAYTLSQAKGMADEDGWVGLTWNHPLKYADNYDLTGFDRTHIFQIGFIYELPFLKRSNNFTGKAFGGWQVNGIFAKYSGTPFSIGGTNDALNCAACGSVLANVSGSVERMGKVGSDTETYYDPKLFSHPTGQGVEGFGNTGRTEFRRPRVWNLDASLFKAFKLTERIKSEFRIEVANLFNHTNWGAPSTGINDINFLKFTPGAAENGTNTPGARRIQFGLRVTF
jgi:carboxypeptidase family protein/TonB-dependent receptor-like protein